MYTDSKTCAFIEICYTIERMVILVVFSCIKIKQLFPHTKVGSAIQKCKAWKQIVILRQSSHLCQPFLLFLSLCTIC